MPFLVHVLCCLKCMLNLIRAVRFNNYCMFPSSPAHASHIDSCTSASTRLETDRGQVGTSSRSTTVSSTSGTGSNGRSLVCDDTASACHTRTHKQYDSKPIEADNVIIMKSTTYIICTCRRTMASSAVTVRHGKGNNVCVSVLLRPF